MNLQELLTEYRELPEFEGGNLGSVNQQGGWGSTPLHIAIYRENPEEVRVFLDARANPNAEGEYGERPLHVAVNCGNEEIIELLLRAGAKCELRDGKEMDVWQFAEIIGFKNKLAEIVRRIERSKSVRVN